MTAIATFRFGQYTLRPAGSSLWDFRLAKMWTALDPCHAGKIKPEFWIDQEEMSRDAYVLVDRSGPLMFFKTILFGEFAKDPSYTVELFVQFPPRAETAEERLETNCRVRAALMQGVPWMEKVLIQKGVREIFFQSESPSLIRFCVKRLGFTLDGSRLSKKLERRR